MKRINFAGICWAVIVSLMSTQLILASDVNASVVDVIAPTGYVTLVAGASGAITINLAVTGSQVGTATFEVYRDWTLSGGVFAGTNPQEFTVAPRAGGDPATTFSTNGTVSVAAGQAGGTFTLVVGVFDITNTNTTGAKLGAGATGTYQVTVTVPTPSDTTPPVIAPHADVEAEATSAAGATVGYTSPATSDAVDGAGVATCSPASGSLFPLDNTTVTCNATDAAGNGATATTFLVSVVDTTAPALTLPSDILAEATGPTGAAVNYSASASDIVDGSVTVGCLPVSGSTFAIGTTPVACSATDAHSNSANDTFYVTVEDTTPPVIAPHGDIEAEATSAAGATVSYDSPTTTDAVDGAGVATCSPASGSLFPLDNTTVTCNATDVAGNDATPTTFVVSVVDTTAPAIVCGSADGFWHANNVTIACTASDSGSGLANSADANFPLSTNVGSGAEDANASTATHEVCDLRSNCVTAGPISGNMVDRKAPTGITFVGGVADGGSYIFGSVPAAPTCTATDGGSGLASCGVTGYSSVVGPHTLTATATDNVGNTSLASATYSVLAWTLTGFYQPVDMGILNNVKAGSTVPLKFEVFAGSTELTSTSVVQVSSQRISCTAGPSDDIENYATGGTSLRYDTTGGQFIFNWQSPRSPGNCYRITMTTSDGSSIFADFRLK
jgi:hypothetical protein